VCCFLQLYVGCNDEICLCFVQLCSDAVDLGFDTVTVDSLSRDRLDSLSRRDRLDSLSRDSQSAITQLKSDVITSTLTSVVPEPLRDLSRSAELTVTNTHKQSSVMDSTGVHNAVGTAATVLSIVVPSASELASPGTTMSRVSKISVTSHQRPKSLDQEFTLLNLDIPNVTIHGVCLLFILSLFLGTKDPICKIP